MKMKKPKKPIKCHFCKYKSECDMENYHNKILELYNQNVKLAKIANDALIKVQRIEEYIKQNGG